MMSHSLRSGWRWSSGSWAAWRPCATVGPAPLGGPRERTVLAGLLLDAGRVVPVRRLVDLAWDDDPPATAGKQVRNMVSRLRRALAEAGVIVTEAGGYRLALGDECTVDAQVFETRVAAAAVG